MITAAKVEKQGGQRRHPRGKNETATPSLQKGQPFFENLAGRVAAPGVVVAGAFADTRMAVFILDGDRARMREVVVGGRNGEQAWIVSGLRAGDRVILYPGDAVSDGTRVEPRTVPVVR